MNVHILEHDPADGPGVIADWALERGVALARVRLFDGASLPAAEDVRMLVILGGAMSVHQHRDFPWLAGEKAWMAEVIGKGAAVLGICLGAQLLAVVLGGRVFQHDVYEIGWWPVVMVDRPEPLTHFPEELMSMHWHGDTFTLPPGARRVAKSAACGEQGFVWGERVVALQFHPEIDELAAGDVEAVATGEQAAGRFVQSAAELAARPPGLGTTRAALFGLLDALAAMGGA